MNKALFIFPSIVTVALAICFGLASAQVMINEFMADPARDWDGDGVYYYRDDEWVEIINNGEEPVDLSAFLLSDGEDPPVLRYGFSGTLSPGEVRVVYGSDSRLWEESNEFPVYGLSLNNSGDSVYLFIISGGDTVLVDSIGYDGYAAEDDRSMGRSYGDYMSWEIFDAYNPCSGTNPIEANGCVPTPGVVNSCVTEVPGSSWGKVKSLYR